MKNIGLIGIGLMGEPMAMRWLEAGFKVAILPHKNLESATRLKAKGARIASSVNDIASNADAIVLMVPSSLQVEELTLGDQGLIHYVSQSCFVIDMSTSHPTSTQKIHDEFAQAGKKFFDAPVTGGVKGATEGTLTLFVGGPVEWMQSTLSVLKVVSQRQSHFGKVGLGHVAKLINNWICIGNLAVFSEALPWAVKLGLEPTQLFQTLMTGTAQSQMLSVYGPQILKNDFAPRFKLQHALKDIKLCNELTHGDSKSTMILQSIQKVMEKSVSQGQGDENLSALIRTIEDMINAQFREHST
ncbi:MAG: NAD(P)-dependent oxidoreductase [Oligoflexia bacterium]|nr:NAD(P)-dependent oxidoreductase [Oligoflexia bacterium]